MQDWLSSGMVLICLFCAYVALVLWAWSSKRKTTFEAASELPLIDDLELDNSVDITPSIKKDS